MVCPIYMSNMSYDLSDIFVWLTVELAEHVAWRKRHNAQVLRVPGGEDDATARTTQRPLH